MAERVGFEPTKGLSPLTRLAIERLRPLGHLSDKINRREKGKDNLKKKRVKTPMFLRFLCPERNNLQEIQDLILFVFNNPVFAVFKKKALPRGKLTRAVFINY